MLETRHSQSQLWANAANGAFIVCATRRAERELIPAPPTTPIIVPPHPRGAAIRRCAVGGDGGGACGRSHKPDSGGFGAPTWGHYDPCARSSLDRSHRIMPSSHAGRRDNPMRGTGARGLAAEDGLRPDKRGPESEIADKRSATGRADGGSIHPRRILAQRMRIRDPRLAALRCPSFVTPACERGRGFRLGPLRPPRSARWPNPSADDRR